MKIIVGFDQAVGGDGAKVKGSLGIDGSDLALDMKAVYPLDKLVDPAMKAVDALIDKVEEWIPGDQKAMAESLKVEFRADLVKYLSE